MQQHETHYLFFFIDLLASFILAGRLFFPALMESFRKVLGLSLFVGFVHAAIMELSVPDMLIYYVVYIFAMILAVLLFQGEGWPIPVLFVLTALAFSLSGNILTYSMGFMFEAGNWVYEMTGSMILAAAAAFMQWRKVTWIDVMNIDRKKINMMLVIVFQCSQVVVLYYLFFTEHYSINERTGVNVLFATVFTVAGLGLSFALFTGLEKIHQSEMIEAIRQTEQTLIGQIEQLMFRWRSYAHDFHHHIEVMQTLLDEKDEISLKEYMKGIHRSVRDLQKRDFPFAQPAVNALLSAKTIYAEQKDIRIMIDSSETVMFPQLNVYDVIRILGNLLDNAIESLDDANPKEKWIKIEYRTVLNLTILKVSNSGPPIPEYMRENIFRSGYTTKTKHSGIGLAFLKLLIESHGGHIRLASEPDTDHVVFEIVIPLK